MEFGKELIDALNNGTWVAASAFGLYLAYKLAFASVITYGVLRLAGKLFALWESRQSSCSLELERVLSAAGMVWPLTPDEWKELEKRVRPK